MTYRTILVHADRSRHAEARIVFAAELAKRFEAHLIGAAMTGISPFLLPGSIEMGGQMIADQIAEMQDTATCALDHFDVLAVRAGVASHEHRRADYDWDGGMAQQARYADLVVLSQTNMDERAPGASYDLPEFVLMNSARPVLLLPHAGHYTSKFKTVLVAWDGSIEATRAVTCALPLLKQARQVSVLVFDPESVYGRHGEEPGADLALYLARHGVKVDVSVRSNGIDTGNALLSHAADVNADLLVMGSYGHTRFREMMLGGVTRTILSTMTLPVFMAH